MAVRAKPSTIVVFALLACGGLALPARSCGPDLPQAEFVSQRFPDDVTGIAHGHPGILLPTYYQRFLYVAYRMLAGRPLTDQEVTQAVNPPAPSGPLSDAAKRWLAARARVHGQSSEGWTFSDCAKQVTPGLFVYFPSIYDDAYRAADSTLAARIRSEGGVTPAVRDWLAAQEAVFSACADTARPPSPARPGSPSWLTRDRAYQTAAWHFYALDLDQAIAGFRDIAADASSPYRTLAPYLVGRAYLRKATVLAGDHVDEAALREAEKVFESVRRESPDARLRASAVRLLDFTRFRLDPMGRLAVLSRALSAPRPGPDLAHLVFDFTILLDQVSQAEADSLARALPEADIVDWILSFQRGYYAHSLERWRATKSVPWLVATLTHAPAGGPETGELVAAAERVKRGEPAFAMAAFHRARLLATAGQAKRIGPLLDDPALYPPSSRNLLLALRMQLARGFDEFVALAQRPTAGITSYTERGFLPPEPSNKPMFDTDGTLMLNKWTPLDRLAGVAAGPRLEDSLRANVAVAAWTRAVVLGRHDVAARLAPVLASASVGLAPYLAKYRAATRRGRSFESTWILLHMPGATPWVRHGLGRFEPPLARDVFRDNWWCVGEVTPLGWFLAPPDQDDEITRWVRAPDWDEKLAQAIFTPTERAAAVKELDRIVGLGPGPNYLCAQTLDWAKKSPRDPRLPEALHLAVMATRYGCTDKRTSEWSKQVFQTLHKRYPQDAWTKRTKYWY